MLPIKQAIESASTDVEVLRRLSAFLDHPRSCNIGSIVPQSHNHQGELFNVVVSRDQHPDARAQRQANRQAASV